MNKEWLPNIFNFTYNIIILIFQKQKVIKMFSNNIQFLNICMLPSIK